MVTDKHGGVQIETLGTMEAATRRKPAHLYRGARARYLAPAANIRSERLLLEADFSRRLVGRDLPRLSQADV